MAKNQRSTSNPVQSILIDIPTDTFVSLGKALDRDFHIDEKGLITVKTGILVNWVIEKLVPLIAEEERAYQALRDSIREEIMAEIELEGKRGSGGIKQIASKLKNAGQS